MKYFTKYLSVEGEIKEGDHVVDPIIAPKDGLDYVEGDKFINGMGDEVVLPNWRERFKFKKQQLFLCSRDIQPGDKVIYLKTGEERTVISDETYMDEPVLRLAEWRKEPFCTFSIAKDESIHVKKIGEVSPGAVWVTEGMEFDETDIEIVYKNKYECLCEEPDKYRTKKQASCEHMKDDYRGSDFCDRKIRVIDIVKFKCPTCKTFH